MEFLHFGRVSYNYKCRVRGADGPCGPKSPDDGIHWHTR
jgi:hypothetical protein